MNKNPMAWVVATLCFMLSATQVWLATYLFKEGHIPKLRLAPHVYVGFGTGDVVSSVFGVGFANILSNAFFYVFVTVLYGGSLVLFFAGYRLWKPQATQGFDTNE